MTATYTEFWGQSFYHLLQGAQSYGLSASGCVCVGYAAGTIVIEYADRLVLSLCAVCPQLFRLSTSGLCRVENQFLQSRKPVFFSLQKKSLVQALSLASV